ncbi:hypothetical protein TrST_g1547 [Triparma strigata]|uniref:SAPK-interacting protein 1 Pleckstrin-homology domain-containing protein n=1 Tax=Triparma strigata TaxID=1606541 RepID=A0A9W7EZ18_9STRA|nr:hypothetical protein TrST_g1547 [Triparma strigata]
MLFSRIDRVDAFTRSARSKLTKSGPAFHDSQHLEVEQLLSTSPPLPLPESPVARRSSIDEMGQGWAGSGKPPPLGAQVAGGGGRGGRRGSPSPSPTPMDESGGGGGGGGTGAGGLEENVDKKKKEGGEKVPELKVEKVKVDAEGAGGGGGLLAGLFDTGETFDTKEMIPLKIYLPDCSPLKFKLDEEATVEEAIAATLSNWLETTGGGGKLRLHAHAPQCYELRLHEGDGEPDEDFPALDRSRPIKNFGDGDEFEYVLCLIPGVSVPPADSISLNVSNMSSARVRMMSRTSGVVGKACVKIHLPNKTYKIVESPGEAPVKNMMDKLLSRFMPGTSLMTQQFEFKVNESDRKRLGLVTHRVDDMALLKDLNVEELFLKQKSYEDDPVVKSEKDKQEEKNGEDDQPDLESFMFDDITAGRYKEFDIVKKNRFGRRQERRMGIDNVKIYNMKRGSPSGFAGKVFTAYRLISTVRRIDFIKKEAAGFFGEEEEDDRCNLRIDFEEEDKRVVIWEITAASKLECAEIVAKIRYLQDKAKQRNMLAELSKKNLMQN